MFVVFGGNQLDILEDGHLDLFVAVRVDRLLGLFGRLEGGLSESCARSCLSCVILLNRLP